jgi:hypothetical protein
VREKFITIKAAVCKTTVPKNAVFLPYLSAKRGTKVAEKVQPIKKLIPINAIVNLVEPKVKIMDGVNMLHSKFS